MDSVLSAIQSFISPPAGSGSSLNIIQPFNQLAADDGPTAPSQSDQVLLSSTSAGSVFSDERTFVSDSLATASTTTNSLFLLPDDPLSPLNISLAEAEDRLDFFRHKMLPFFPFIDITPDMTIWHLRQSRPFLLRAILTITTFSTQDRQDKVEELKRFLFASILIKVQSSMDLLLGLLTYIAWSTDAFLGRADLMSRLMMLAISLVYDLRLFRPSSTGSQIIMAITQGQPDQTNTGPNDETPYAILERQRAVLACFALSSKYALPYFHC